MKRRYLFVLFCFVFLPGLPRAADQNVCKQSWAAQAQLCYRKCLFPAKTEITASRPFNSLHLPAILFLVLPIPRLAPRFDSDFPLATAGIFPELIKGLDPLVEDPLGARNDRAAPVEHHSVPRPVRVETKPEGRGSLPRFLIPGPRFL